jgi:hypothetical protein
MNATMITAANCNVGLTFLSVLKLAALDEGNNLINKSKIAYASPANREMTKNTKTTMV